MDEQIQAQIDKIKGVRQPTRTDVLETLLLLVNTEFAYRLGFMTTYANAVSEDPDKLIDDLFSYPEYTQEVVI